MKSVPYHNLNSGEDRADSNSKIRIALVNHPGFGWTVDKTMPSGRVISSPIFNSFDMARSAYNRIVVEETANDPIIDKIMASLRKLFA